VTDGGLALCIAGQTLVLRPERAVFWLEARTLIVADTHFGKSGLLGRSGMAVPAGTDASDQARLCRLADGLGAARLIVLGDFVHGPLDPDSGDARDLARWVGALGIHLHVVAGNHDRRARLRLPPMQWCDEFLDDGPFRFRHDADSDDTASTVFTLSGHLHPMVRLAGLRKRTARVPIFWQRRHGLVLPSFGTFTGGFAVTAAAEDRVYAAGPERVVAFRAPGA
jgi:DNA ligase-associated metallophosphoesterase